MLNKSTSSIQKIIQNSLKQFFLHEGSVRSGYIAFCMLLGIFPLIIFSANLSGLFLGEKESSKIINILISIAPSYLKTALQPTIEAVIKESRIDLMSITFIASIWFPSKAVDGLRVGFDHAYGQDASSGWLKGRLISMAVVIVGVLVSIVLGGLVVLGPMLTRMAEEVIHLKLPFSAAVLRNTAGFITFVVFMWCLHRFLPSRTFRHGNHIWSGILVASVIWVLVAIGFGIYLDHSRHYQIFYGALAGVAITMMFFYFTCVIFLISAEINACLDTASADHSLQ